MWSDWIHFDLTSYSLIWFVSTPVCSISFDVIQTGSVWFDSMWFDVVQIMRFDPIRFKLVQMDSNWLGQLYLVRAVFFWLAPSHSLIWFGLIQIHASWFIVIWYGCIIFLDQCYLNRFDWIWFTFLWYDLVWFEMMQLDSVLFDLFCADSIWCKLIRFNTICSDSSVFDWGWFAFIRCHWSWFGSMWYHVILFDSAWLDLVHFDLGWFDLIWFSSSCFYYI